MNNYAFQRPRIKRIVKEGFSAVDMHTHSIHSDGFNNVRSMLKKAKNKKCGIALTDHSTSAGCIDAYKNNRELLKNVMFIPGIEINCFDGPHLLCYFYNINELVEFDSKFVKPYKTKNPNGRLGKSMLFYIDKLRYYNVLVSIAHPCAPMWMNFMKRVRENPENLKVLTFSHAIEIINGAAIRKHNLKAVEMNEFLNKSITAGSDGHSLLQLGSVLTCAKADNVEDFLDAIKLKKNFVIGKEIGAAKRIILDMQIFRKHIKYLPSWMKESYRRQYPGGVHLKKKLLKKGAREEDF